MCEDKIIKNLNNFVAFAQKEENFTYYSEYKFDNELADFVQGLLDLYQKEKEENKFLKQRNEAISNNMLSLASNSISKDKIRAKLKELEEEQKEYKESQEWEIQDDIDAQINILKELLEEE